MSDSRLFGDKKSETPEQVFQEFKSLELMFVGSDSKKHVEVRKKLEAIYETKDLPIEQKAIAARNLAEIHKYLSQSERFVEAKRPEDHAEKRYRYNKEFVDLFENNGALAKDKNMAANFTMALFEMAMHQRNIADGIFHDQERRLYSDKMVYSLPVKTNEELNACIKSSEEGIDLLTRLKKDSQIHYPYFVENYKWPHLTDTEKFREFVDKTIDTLEYYRSTMKEVLDERLKETPSPG